MISILVVVRIIKACIHVSWWELDQWLKQYRHWNNIQQNYKKRIDNWTMKLKFGKRIYRCEGAKRNKLTKGMKNNNNKGNHLLKPRGKWRCYKFLMNTKTCEITKEQHVEYDRQMLAAPNILLNAQVSLSCSTSPTISPLNRSFKKRGLLLAVDNSTFLFNTCKCFFFEKPCG